MKRILVYKAPKLTAITYDEDSKKRLNKKKDKLEKKLKNSDMVKELKNAIGEEPEEEFSIGSEHSKKNKVSQYEKEIEEFELENFKRVNLKKKEKGTIKKNQSKLVDELEELESMNELLNLDRYLKKKDDHKEKVTLLQYLGDVEDAQKALEQDDEQPKEDQEEQVPKKRKRKEEKVKEKKEKKVHFSESLSSKKKKRQEEDEILERTLEKSENRKINQKIERNRGLVPKRKKEDKNPRLKIRSKYEKKTQKNEYSNNLIEKNTVKSKKIKV